VVRLQLVKVRRLGLLTCLIAGVPGCTTTWDDVTSRNFHVRSIWETSDPMTVLHDSTDGDERAKALRALKEPRANGGNDAEQERVIQVLTQAAVNDPQPLCRLAAVQTLGRFTDPRSVQILTAAYDAAPQLPSEVAGAIQSATLVSLGNTKQQTAIAFLVRAATKPTSAEAVDREINQARDVRLAAVRALKSFEGSAEVAAAMVQIMRAERDVALQDRAHETYVKVTGREPPVDSQPAPNAPAPLPSRTDDVKLAGGAK
jgi:hypothetical protein